jgi:hypothetical protein
MLAGIIDFRKMITYNVHNCKDHVSYCKYSAEG